MDSPSEPRFSRMKARFARLLYSAAWLLLLPIVMLYLLWRSRRQPAYRRFWAERLGVYGDRFAGLTYRNRSRQESLIWLHAVSVGETRAAQPLIKALLQAYPEHQLLLTHGTPTGRATGRELFGDRVARCYLPYDQSCLVGRFLRTFRPEIGIIMETELWPNLVAAAHAERLPLILANARLSEKSLRKGLRTPWLIKPAIAGLSAVLAQTKADADRLARLGRSDVQVVGNIKFDVEPKQALVEQGRRWRLQDPDRPVILLASSRDGEEIEVLNAWANERALEANSRHVSALLAIVPRHPQRFNDVRQLIQRFTDRSADRKTLADGQLAGAELLLGDSMGEMFAYYAMADVAIIGGSLLPFGGQNLIEACALGVPVIIGQHTYNFEQVAEQAVDCGAAVRVNGARAALQKAIELAHDADKRLTMGAAGRQFALAHRGATTASMAVFERFLTADR